MENEDEQPLSDVFMQKMKEQIKEKRRKYNVPLPTIQGSEQKHEEVDQAELEKREIEKELGITKGTFKFKKTKKIEENAEEDKPIAKKEDDEIEVKPNKVKRKLPKIDQEALLKQLDELNNL